MTFHRKCLHRIDLLWLAVVHLFRADQTGQLHEQRATPGTSRTSSQRDYLYWWSPITYYTMIIMSRPDESRGGVAINYCFTAVVEDEAAEMVEEIDFPPFEMSWEELALDCNIAPAQSGNNFAHQRNWKIVCKIFNGTDFSKDSSGWSRAAALEQQFTEFYRALRCPSSAPGEMIDLFGITILAKCLWLWKSKKVIF